MSLEIRITTVSPLCLSGGLSFGAGEEDTQTELDRFLPIFRGRTLKGLLSEEVAAILPLLEKDREAWHKAAAELFGLTGSSSSAAAGFGNGTLSAEYRSAASRWGRLATEALTVTRRQTQIDRTIMTPKKGSLRGSRLTRSGLTFHFPVYEREPLSEKALILLAAGSASLKRAGLHRNRGWGEIQVTLWLDGADRTKELIRGLKEHVTVRRAKASPSPTPKSVTAKTLQLDITLNSPAVLAKTGAEPSTVETHDFIPGTSILGAIASRWLAKNKVDDPATDATFRKLFLDGTTRYLNAYPLRKGNRYLPVPRTFLHEKYDEAKVKDIASEDAAAGADDKSLGSGFVWISDDDTAAFDHLGVETTTSLHHQRDRALGRSSEESGALYSYQAIAAGQTFRSCILLDDESLAADLVGLLNDHRLNFGRSRSATYGGSATVEVKAARKDWREYPREDLDDHERLIVTLLSDYVGEHLGLANPESLEADLRARLDLPESIPVSKYLATGQAGGYVSAWRMPRPTSVTLAAGSVFVFHTSPAKVSEEALRSLERDGLGARRAEGFGRLAFCWHGDKDQLRGDKVSFKEPTPTRLETPGFAAVQERVAHHLLEKTLRRQAFDQVSHLRNRAPSPSLLGRVRMRIRTARDAAEFRAFLDSVKVRKDHRGNTTDRLKEAGKSLVSCRIEQQDLWSWLYDWSTGTKGWPVDVVKALRREGLPEDTGRGEWRWVKVYLDAFLEALRRRAKSK